MIKILARKETAEQEILREVKMSASIYPVKFIDRIECENLEYVDLFNADLSPRGTKFPPFTNRGGIKNTSCLSSVYDLTPPTENNSRFTCIVDYLSFTFSLGEYQNIEQTNNQKIDVLFESLSHYLPHLLFYPQQRGLFGYRQSLGLTRSGVQAGLIGFDGNNNSCYVSLSGQGCVGVDMSAFRRFIEKLPRCKITRVDLAHDDLEGALGVQDYRKMYESGDFSIKGTSPSARFIDDFGTGKGCTLYVGHKKNGKEACIYEKGKQQGDKESRWLRVEGRITSVDRVVPFEVLDNPAQYLAALYPPFSGFSAIHAHIEIIKKSASIAYDSLVKYASVAYGKLICFMQEELGMENDAIIGALIREGRPARLLNSCASELNLVPF
jgi:phage replication initiation protein